MGKLTVEQRRVIYGLPRDLGHGEITRLAKQFGVSPHTVWYHFRKKHKKATRPKIDPLRFVDGEVPAVSYPETLPTPLVDEVLGSKDPNVTVLEAIRDSTSAPSADRIRAAVAILGQGTRRDVDWVPPVDAAEWAAVLCEVLGSQPRVVREAVWSQRPTNVPGSTIVGSPEIYPESGSEPRGEPL